MEEIKTKGIILNSNDFGEADKLATVFSLEYGKIVVKFNGVRKQKAKLKSLAQPFSFVEIECFKRGDFFTVKTGLVVDSFPKITNNFTTTICAYIIMEIILFFIKSTGDIRLNSDMLTALAAYKSFKRIFPVLFYVKNEIYLLFLL